MILLSSEEPLACTTTFSFIFRIHHGMMILDTVTKKSSTSSTDHPNFSKKSSAYLQRISLVFKVQNRYTI